MTTRNKKGQFTATETTTKTLKITGFVTEYDEYIVERVGQRDADESDGVQVKLTIALRRTAAEDWRIDPKIRFGRRVEIAELNLFSMWGSEGPGRSADWRTVTRAFSAQRWSEAMDKAQNYAVSELLKLKSALDTRAKALIDAEEN